MLAASALFLPLAAVATIGVGTASAARSNPTGTGTENCTAVTGTITFSPPLTSSGTAAETTTVSAKATGCSGGSPVATAIAAHATITGGTSACSSLATAAPPTFTDSYTPSSISPSSVSGGTETEVTSPHIGFTISNETVTGSYPSTTASVSATTSETVAKLTKACDKKGLKKLKIKSGSVSNL
jgi:hypothetical protein